MSAAELTAYNNCRADFRQIPAGKRRQRDGGVGDVSDGGAEEEKDVGVREEKDVVVREAGCEKGREGKGAEGWWREGGECGGSDSGIRRDSERQGMPDGTGWGGRGDGGVLKLGASSYTALLAALVGAVKTQRGVGGGGDTHIVARAIGVFHRMYLRGVVPDVGFFWCLFFLVSPLQSKIMFV